jgi:hypothetical protein
MYGKDIFDAELRKNWATAEATRPKWYTMGSQDSEIHGAWKLYGNALESTLPELLLGEMKLRSSLDVLNNFGTTSGVETTMERGTLKDGKNRNVGVDATTETLTAQMGKAFNAAAGIAHIRRGSVLNDGWWWPLKNDAWMLGGIHGLKRFHLALEAVPDDLIWDAKAGRPRVLGRELIGLRAAGYSLIGLPSWEIPAPKPASGGTTPPTPSPAPSKPSWASLVAGPTVKPAQTGPKKVAPADVRRAIGFVFAPKSADTARTLTFKAYWDELAKIKTINDIKNTILKDEVLFKDYDFGKV